MLAFRPAEVHRRSQEGRLMPRQATGEAADAHDAASQVAGEAADAHDAGLQAGGGTRYIGGRRRGG